MNSKRKTTKTLALLAAMAVGLALPSSVEAQQGGKGGVFGRGSDSGHGNEKGTTGMLNQSLSTTNGGLNDQIFGGTNGGFVNEGFGTPIGGGLLILVAAGAGYAILKRKEDKQ